MATPTIHPKPTTFKPEAPNLYSKNQIILDSGRLLFNATTDNQKGEGTILMFASQAIGLSSAGTINLDSDKECVINALYIDLGLNASQPVLKGDTTVNTLDQIISQLIVLCNSLSTAVGVPAGAPMLSINTVASAVSAQLSGIQGTLDELKSKTTFTA